MTHRLSTLLLGLVASGAVHAAEGADTEASPEVIDVQTQAGKAPRPSLRLQLPEYNLQTQDLRFPSGLRVMFQRDPTEPVVAITSVTDHGSSDDPLGKEGIAHLVEHLWFRSEHGDLPKVWDLLESEMGCSLNAFTQYDITAYMTVCASHNLEPMMKLESLRITDTIREVTEEMVTTEVEVVRNEIRMRSENFNIPFFTVWEYVNKHMFPEGHPYHRPIAGDHTTIRNCKLADVQKFTEDYYQPDTTTMMVVGDLPTNDFNYLVDLIVRTFDLSLLHEDLSDEHLRRAPKPGVDNPDPNNADDWYLVPMNPENPDEPLPIQVQLPPRAAQFADLTPPDPVTTEIGEYEGPVEDPTVAISWTLPAGYQGEDTLMQVTGSLLNGVMASGLESPDLDSFQGCGALPSKRSTTLVCTATMKSADGNAEQIADRMMDQVANLIGAMTDPVSKQFFDMQFSRARMDFLSGLLNSVDLFAAVGAGRATNTSQHAHFTGSAAYFNDKMLEVNQLQSFQVAEMVDQWLKRDRSSAVLIKPMERDEVAMLSEDTEGSGGHYRGGGESSILNPSIPPERITPALVRELITTPDVTKLTDFKLPNGLRVVIMPHGEAPLVNADLIVNGGSAGDRVGYTTFANTFTTDDAQYGQTLTGMAALDPLQVAGAWRGGSATTYESMGIRASGGNLDGALWLLRERVDSQRPYLAGKGQWLSRRRSGIKRNWKDTDWHISDMRNDHINPGHVLNDGIDWEDLDLLKKANGKTIKEQLASTWQPANATLLIVGNIDPNEAKKQAIQYFGGWRAGKGVEPKARAEVPGPNPAKDKAIYVFDDEGKTQTEVTLACPLKPAENDPSAAHQLLGDIARMTLFTKLREEAGVVYSPFAGAFVSPGGTATMYMTAAIQNDSAVFALGQYLDFLEKSSAGELAEIDLKVKKVARASNYVIGQQSIDQMSGRLTGTITRGLPWSSFEDYATNLANITVDDLAELTKGCADHAFISFKGPKDDIAAQLDEAELEYTIVDVDERYEELYEAADPKGFAKYLKNKEKEEEKEDSEDEDSEDEGSED